MKKLLKFTQICVSYNKAAGSDILYALAEDGTLWERDSFDNWKELDRPVIDAPDLQNGDRPPVLQSFKATDLT